MLLILVAVLLTGWAVGQTPPEPQCICLEELAMARGMRNPLILRSPNDGTDRRFIGEQIGLVWIFLSNGLRLPDPYLNLTELVISGDYWGDERGFLQIAFHPNFRDNRKLYMFYTVEDENEELYTRLSEIQQSASNPNVVDYLTHRVLLNIFQLFGNHNGGDLHFGSDGFLYMSTGDGGLAGDPMNVALDPVYRLGKMLRIDVDRRDPGLEYAIPRDNPFLNNPRAAREVYAVGFRNPWRCDFDEGDRRTGAGRGRIFIADVGQNWMEEVNILQRGGIFGWSAWEGTTCYKPEICGEIGDAIFPIFLYNHTVGQAIIGGHVYRGAESPAFNGMYFYADFMSSRIFRLKEENNTWTNREIFTCGTEFCRARGLEGIDHSPDNDYKQILSWGEDSKGEVYFMNTELAIPTNPAGSVFKIVDPYNRVIS